MSKTWRMRRISVFLVALIAVGVAATPARAGIRIEHRAQAIFMLPERNGSHPAFFVDALRMSGYKGGFSVGSLNIGFGITRGVCLDRHDVDSCMITDKSRSVGGNFRKRDVFEFEDDLTSARLVVTRKGITHRVTWSATSDPAPVVRDVDCGLVPVGTGVGAMRTAKAKGRVFGHSVTSVGSSRLPTSLDTVAYTC